jgi:hypothetical protein
MYTKPKASTKLVMVERVIAVTREQTILAFLLSVNRMEIISRNSDISSGV